MEGFFDPVEVFGEGSQKDCSSCRLFLDCDSPKMDVSGRGDKQILIVGEYPTKTDDLEGVQFKGNSGQILRTAIRSLGLKLSTDFWKVNAVQCYPGKRKITANEVESCRVRLKRIIKQLKPKMIIPLGKLAFESLIGDRIKGRLKIGKYTDWVGEVIPDQEIKIFIAPNYSPVFLMENSDNPFFLQDFKRHWKRAMDEARKPFIITNYKSDIQTTTDMIQAIEWLENEVGEYTTWDIETTGRKPEREGHKIKTIAFSNGLNAFAFPWFDHDDFRVAWRKVTNGPTKLIAHNAQFESIWNRVKAGRWPTKWHWCTMTGAHSLHNKKPTGLKFLAYAHHGIISYDEDIHKYITKSIEPKKYGANSFNDIDNAPMDDLLFYDGMDAHITHKEWEYQERVFIDRLKKGVKFFTESGDTFAKIHANGFRINTELMDSENTRLQTMLDAMLERINNMDEVKRFPGNFSITSNPNLKKLLYSILKYPMPEEKPTDKTALNKINTPFTRAILRYRKNSVMLNTYIGQFTREVVNGYIHPFFNLAGGAMIEDGGKTVSYRGSSSNPNFQNNPKRDKKQMKTIRSLIIPRPGRKLIEYDNKGNEVKAGACITKDKNLIEHEMDDSLDMHRDVGALLFMLDKGEVDKKVHRHPAKNGFVFPQFYGSSYRACAPALWDMVDEDTRIHLHKKGITSPDKWLLHVKTVEDYLWGRFSGYARWKNRTQKFYAENGYVDLITGFRCYGPMDYKQVTNYPIQGPAFHIMLWTLNRVVEILRRNRMETLCIGQIHDSMIFDAVPDEEKELDRIVHTIGTQDVCNHWDWITIPPVIEKEVSKINGSFADMEDCGYLG